jgi:hypothetical protein
MNMKKNPFLTLELRSFEGFMRRWESGVYRGLRLGQAFYNEYNLHRLKDQSALRGLYEADSDVARVLIRQIFTFS